METLELTEARLAKLSPPEPGAGQGLKGFWPSAALFATGFGAFVNLYAPQPMLPRFREVFHASELMVSLVVSAPVLAVAIAAPFMGILADAVGRKRVIVAAMLGLSIPTLMTALSVDLGQLLVWRFLQGLFIPGVIAVAMAYISEESPRESLGACMSTYVSGTIAGGFAGRLMAGMLEPILGWRLAFAALGVCAFLMAAITWRMLPRSSKFKRQADIAGSVQAILSHLGNKQLMATCLIGFNILFTLVGVFTYVNFYLAGEPFNLGSAALSLIFSVYLAGVVVTPLAGRLMDRIGSRRALLIGSSAALAGVSLTLIHSLFAVIAGLALMSLGVFASQTCASSQVGKAAGSARSSAAGLYVAFYYLGGCAGSVAPGMIWHFAAWPGCVAIMVCIQLFAAAIAWRMWKA